MRILDRYILKNCLVPFLYCFFGFVAIWLLFDFTMNAGDFIAAKAPVRLIVFYYMTQMPEIIVILLPASLLLALLHSLGRMSRANEIISMLTAGQSLARLIAPLVAVGMAVAALSFAMNYKLAPHAVTTRKTIRSRLTAVKQVFNPVIGQLFRNRIDNRTWFVQIQIDPFNWLAQMANLDLNLLRGIHITQQDADGNILRIYYAHGAAFDPQSKVWTFFNGKTVRFDLDGNVTGEEYWKTRKIEGWSETPWRIVSSNFEAQTLSLPELRDYLRFNADFPESQLAPYRTYFFHRWATPFICLVVVFIAVPLGIVHSRRGALTGAAGAIFIFFGMMFFDKLFLALGKGGRIPALAAAWGPNGFFAVLGLFLLYLRATNRDFPRWNLKRILASPQKNDQ